MVDDNEDSATSMALLLGFNGNDTAMAFSGPEALKRVASSTGWWSACNAARGAISLYPLSLILYPFPGASDPRPRASIPSVKLKYIRIFLRTLAIGLTAVWIVGGLKIAWRDKTVDLPTASEEALPVFMDNQRVLTPQKNCGKDPHDPQNRLDCTNEKLYENRDLSGYKYYEVRCDLSDYRDHEVCASADARLRALIWQHWRQGKRAHIVEHFIGHGWNGDWHCLVEPNDQGQWRVVTKDVDHRWYLVDDQETKIHVVSDERVYVPVGWKVASEDDVDFRTPVGTHFLRLVNERGDEWLF
jgi:CheY-like chemotaxis protein